MRAEVVAVAVATDTVAVLITALRVKLVSLVIALTLYCVFDASQPNVR